MNSAAGWGFYKGFVGCGFWWVWVGWFWLFCWLYWLLSWWQL
jgi:hypothetical protein